MFVDHATYGAGRDAELPSDAFFAPVVGAKSAGKIGLADAADVELAVVVVARNYAGHLDTLLADAVGKFEAIALGVQSIDLRYDVVAQIAIKDFDLIVGDLLKAVGVLTLCVFAHRIMICFTNINQCLPEIKSAMQQFVYSCRIGPQDEEEIQARGPYRPVFRQFRM